jgi:hypothetical protein
MSKSNGNINKTMKANNGSEANGNVENVVKLAAGGSSIMAAQRNVVNNGVI